MLNGNQMKWLAVSKQKDSTRAALQRVLSLWHWRELTKFLFVVLLTQSEVELCGSSLSLPSFFLFALDFIAPIIINAVEQATMKMMMMALHSLRAHLLILIFIALAASVCVALAPPTNRRTALSHLAVMGAFPLIVATTSPACASLTSPQKSAITTVILESSQDRIGVQLSDVSIGTRSFPAVKSVSATGEAFASGVVPGMVLLGIQGGSSKAVVERIKSGPYPIVLQFYNLAMEDGSNVTAEQALIKAIEQGRKEADTGPPVSAKGTGLVVKTVKKGDCDIKARRGDTLVINYEGRVASPGGPIFAEASDAQVVLGKHQVPDGVDIGLAGMCPGEIRTLDIPSALGFGKQGSQVFDVPGDVRLWWEAELVKLVKKS